MSGGREALTTAVASGRMARQHPDQPLRGTDAEIEEAARVTLGAYLSEVGWQDHEAAEAVGATELQMTAQLGGERPLTAATVLRLLHWLDVPAWSLVGDAPTVDLHVVRPTGRHLYDLSRPGSHAARLALGEDDVTGHDVDPLA